MHSRFLVIGLRQLASVLSSNRSKERINARSFLCQARNVGMICRFCVINISLVLGLMLFLSFFQFQMLSMVTGSYEKFNVKHFFVQFFRLFFLVWGYVN